MKRAKLVYYCLGEDADDVLVLTNVTEDECKRYKDVMAKFDDHFKIRCNLIFERAKFNKKVQLVGESAEQYITALYQLAENCNYGELKSEMICDRLVVGITDDSLSQQLQMDPELTLDKVKTRIR